MKRPRRAKRPPPIDWQTCPHCGKRYDHGNAYAAAKHRGQKCAPTTHPDTPDGAA